MRFSDLGLSEPLLAGVTDAGYTEPTPIQQRAVPLALKGSDVIALGETGSGKTAAFGLPILERLGRDGPGQGLRALILVPTRELCVQVAENLRVYASHTGLAIRTAFGGIPIGVQEAAFKRGLDVLVACPGRLIDHLQLRNVTLDDVGTLVLDEADRMLDMGFMPQIRRILARLPGKRQNCMFSATMPTEIERLVEDHFGRAELVQVGKRSQSASTITHRFESVRGTDKPQYLERLLRKAEGRVLIFVKTKLKAEEVGKRLQRAGLPADSIHGDKSAESRYVVLQAFSRGKVQHLVATDVAARGIDVSDIRLVLNFDLPMSVEDYIHRCGRTGRAGSEGEALSLITRADTGLQKSILAHLDKTSKGARVVVDGKVVRDGGGERRKAERADDGEADDRPTRGERRERADGDRPRRRRRSGSRDDETTTAVLDEAPPPPARESGRSSKATVALRSRRRDDSASDDDFGTAVGDEGSSRSESADESTGDDRPRRRRRRKS